MGAGDARALLMIALALLALAIIGVATALLSARTSISIIVRKDPDMATIKERLAALEAAHPDFATKADVDALAGRVTEVEGEIGTDPAPASAEPASPQTVDPATGLPA